MIAHISIHVSDSEKSKEFYTKALAPLKYEVVAEMPEWNLVGIGVEGKADTWIIADGVKQTGHVAYAAQDIESVQKFYDAALAAGGTDNGAPGYRKEYSSGYYAAFVYDPDGHNIEVVFNDPNPAE